MMKRRMLSWLMVLAMLCTLVPTAFAARTNELDIEIDADVDDGDEYYFEDVYDEIAKELDDLGYDVSRDYYFVEFSYDEDEFDTELWDDDDKIEDADYDYEYIDLDYVEYLYLYVDLADDKWEGSYTVEDEDEEEVLTGDIIIYFDGRSGGSDVELTWAYDDDYYFDSDDTEEGVSVYDAIDEIVEEELSRSKQKRIDGYYFSADSKSDKVADLKQDKDDEEWYLSINDTGVWTGEWIAYEDVDDDGVYSSKKDTELLSGDISIEITTGASSGGDIIYTATVDDDVTLDVEDFEEFWEDEYSKGTLEYVIFGSVSSRQGELVDEDGEKLSSKDECYADPGRKDIDLGGVTFEPKKGYTGPVAIDFTAYGTNDRDKDTELKGTLTILYTEGEPEAITYNVQGDAVTLDGDDFLDKGDLHGLSQRHTAAAGDGRQYRYASQLLGSPAQYLSQCLLNAGKMTAVFAVQNLADLVHNGYLDGGGTHINAQQIILFVHSSHLFLA